MNRRFDVLTLGETMAVIAADGCGPLRSARSARLTVAGAESTVAMGVCRLGGTARWLGSLGDDELGELVLTHLRSAGVDVRVARRELPTGLMIKERRTASTTRVHYYRSGLAGSLLEPGQVTAQDVVEAAWLHVTGISPALSASAAAAVETAVRLAGDVGTSVSFDVNYRRRLWAPAEARRRLRPLLERADIVFATGDEAAVLLGRDPAVPDQRLDDESALAGLVAATDATVVLKRGIEGAVAAPAGPDRTVRVVQPAFPAVVSDPVGTGDAFVAGYLADAARGVDVAGALRTAAAVAAIAIGSDGDWEGLPTRAEVDALLGADDIVR